MWKGETRGDGGEEDNKSFEYFFNFFYRNYILIPVFFWKSDVFHCTTVFPVTSDKTIYFSKLYAYTFPELDFAKVHNTCWATAIVASHVSVCE